MVTAIFGAILHIIDLRQTLLGLFKNILLRYLLSFAFTLYWYIKIYINALSLYISNNFRDNKIISLDIQIEANSLCLAHLISVMVNKLYQKRILYQT